MVTNEWPLQDHLPTKTIISTQRCLLRDLNNECAEPIIHTLIMALASSGVKENVFPNNMMVLLWKILFLMIILLSPMMLWLDYSVEIL